MTAVVIALLIFTLIREGLFWHQTQLLLNKLMSRDYATYQAVVSSDKLATTQPHSLQEPDLPEDLRPLAGIG